MDSDATQRRKLVKQEMANIMGSLGVIEMTPELREELKKTEKFLHVPREQGYTYDPKKGLEAK
jgi:hypothetical protein